jgi:tetratricopeptide (TPR) repeat protein
LIAATKESPAKVALYRHRLDLYSKLEHTDPNLVADDLLKIGHLEPQNVEVQMQFAISQWQRQPSSALQSLNQVLKIQPNNAAALSLRARLQIEHKLNAEAIQDSTRAIELDPRAAINFSTRSQAHLNSKQYNEAIADATSAIALQPDLADPYYTEGAAYQALQRNQESLAALNQYLQLTSKNAAPNDEEKAQIEAAKRRVEFVEGSLATVERQNAVRSQNESKSH